MNRAEARERKGKQRAQIVCEILFKLINERTFAGTLPPIEFEFVSIWTDRARALAIFSDDSSNFHYAYKEGRPVIYVFVDGQRQEPKGTGFNIEGLFHSLMHYYCYLHGIQKADTRAELMHGEEFRKAVMDRRGTALYMDDRRGYCETIMNSIEKNWIMERAGNEIPQELKRQEFYERQRRAKERRGAEWE